MTQIFVINQEIKAIIKNNNIQKSHWICLNFNKTFKNISGMTPSKPHQKTGRRSVNGCEAPILLRHSDNPLHQTFLDPPLYQVQHCYLPTNFILTYLYIGRLVWYWSLIIRSVLHYYECTYCLLNSDITST